MTSPASHPAQESRSPALDMFRGLAALTIVLYHLLAGVAETGIGTPFAYAVKCLRLGWTAVDAFFVLSGFLIGTILLRARGAPGYYKTFYARRAFRILPLYLLLLALSWGLTEFAPGWQLEADTKETAVPTWSYWMFLQNQFMADTALRSSVTLGLTWSLAVEEQFYLLMPLLVACLRPRLLPWFLLGGMLSAILLRSVTGGPTAYFLLPTRMDALMAGVLLAVLVASPRSRQYLEKHRHLLGAFGVCILLAGSAWILLTGQTTSGSGPIGGWIMIGAWLGSVLILAFLVAKKADDSRPGPLSRALAPLRWIGLRAYGVYLLHPWAQLTAFHLAGQERRLTETEGWGPTLGALALTFLLAEISFRLLEAPAMRLGRQLFPQPARHAPAAGGSVVVPRAAVPLAAAAD